MGIYEKQQQLMDNICEDITSFRTLIAPKDESKKDRLMTVLYNLLESITIGTSLLSAFIPDSCEKTIKMLNSSLRNYEGLNNFGLNKEYCVTDAPEILFARIDVAKVMEKVGACKIILDKDCNADNIEKAIEEMLSKDAKEISKKAKRVMKLNACEEVYNMIKMYLK